MFTLRKMFSSSFVISAVRVDETTWTWGLIRRRRSAAISPASGPTPPTIFGRFSAFHCVFPGSMRSG
jgi:hypothetical protein